MAFQGWSPGMRIIETRIKGLVPDRVKSTSVEDQAASAEASVISLQITEPAEASVRREPRRAGRSSRPSLRRSPGRFECTAVLEPVAAAVIVDHSARHTRLQRRALAVLRPTPGSVLRPRVLPNVTVRRSFD